MHFQKLQDRHKLCILDMTLFAYDYLFEQHRNSHDEYLSEQKYFQPRGRHDHGLLSGAVKLRFGESLKRPTNLGQISIWITWSIGRSNEDLLVVGQRNTTNRGTSLHPKSTDIVGKKIRKIKDPLG